MTEKEPLYNLSRRRVLGGLGAIGLASAGAGLGTSAFFSDTEPFEGNVLTAGELNLRVNYYSWWDQDTAGSDSRSGLVDGPESTVSGILDDIKPGDEGMLAFCFEIVDNPAYLWTCGSLVANDDNGLTEPEGEVDETGGNGEGELADAIMVNAFYGDVTVSDGFDPSDVTDGNAILSGVTLAEFLAQLEDGLPLDGDGTGGVLDPGTQTEFAGSTDGGNPCLIIEWWVPTDVGNEIQTDSLEFDLLFSAMQARHNDGTANPCVSVQEVSGPGWSKLDIEGFGTSEMQAKVRAPYSGNESFVGRGTEYGSSANTSAEIGTSIPDGTYVPFTLDYDGAGTLSWTYDSLSPISYSGSDLGTPQDKIAINIRAGLEGSAAGVRNVELSTGSVTESIDDFTTDPTTDNVYRGLVGIPDLADGFTLTGEMMLDFDAPVESERVAMYAFVDTSP